MVYEGKNFSSVVHEMIIDWCLSRGEDERDDDDDDDDCGDEDRLPFLTCCSALIFLHVSPRALEKWSSTEPASRSIWGAGSRFALISDQVEPPRDLAKWSSTVPGDRR